MDAIEMIKERRSIRSFTEEKVDRKIMDNILGATLYSPTWGNFKIPRYTVVDSEELLKKLANECFNDFAHNTNIMNKAVGALIVSYVKGKSGCLPNKGFVTPKGDAWEMFDAGIACQTFCLAAHEKGVGTVIMGIFDEKKIAELINLPENESIAAVIPYGYETTHPKAPKTQALEDVVRYL